MYVCIGILYKMHYGNVEKKHCMQNTSERGALLVVFILPKKKKKIAFKVSSWFKLQFSCPPLWELVARELTLRRAAPRQTRYSFRIASPQFLCDHFRVTCLFLFFFTYNIPIPFSHSYFARA